MELLKRYLFLGMLALVLALSGCGDAGEENEGVDNPVQQENGGETGGDGGEDDEEDGDS